MSAKPETTEPSTKPERTIQRVDAELTNKMLFRKLAAMRGETRTDGFDNLLDERLALREAEVKAALEGPPFSEGRDRMPARLR